jgi:hypothetical protein
MTGRRPAIGAQAYTAQIAGDEQTVKYNTDILLLYGDEIHLGLGKSRKEPADPWHLVRESEGASQSLAREDSAASVGIAAPACAFRMYASSLSTSCSGI